MVPSRYVWLDRLPLTPHGKIDRDALPDLMGTDPAQPLREQSGAPVQERSGAPVEVAIAAIVAELLEVPEVGVDQNFFLLGGHSMLGAQLIVRLDDRYGAEISLRYLFDHPTPAELAVEVERQLAADLQPQPTSGLTAGSVSG